LRSTTRPARVWQSYQSPISFTANTAQTFSAMWTVPSALPTGAYTLRMGVFTAAWTFQAWKDSAATLSVY